jgi:CheY-like chemotaxis protein
MKLALVIDSDPTSRGLLRALLESRGHDVVFSSSGLAGLELIQRLPASFSLVFVDLDVSGLPGAAVVEALRIFHPGLPVFCMSRRVTALPAGCLRKPIVPEVLDSLFEPTSDVSEEGWELSVDEETVAEMRARYGSGMDLVEAALELSKGLRREE